MKINKKVLIPVFATAMGLSVIGGVSGAVAWYQYNTKVQASFMGITTADGGVLQIKKHSETKWGRFANYGAADDKKALHPVTFGGMTSAEALPSNAYKHPHAGAETAEMSTWDAAVEGTDYYQLQFDLQALKLNPTSKEWEAVEAPVHLEELILDSEAAGASVAEAVRVHISAGTSNKLYSKSGGSIDTHGELDLDKDGDPDEVGGYAWDYDDTPIDYGDNGTQASLQFNASATASADNLLFTVPTTGLTVTVTIWLEGWQKINSSAIWDATRDADIDIHFGMKLFTPADTFLNDAD